MRKSTILALFSLLLSTFSVAQTSMQGIVINEILPNPVGSTSFDTDGDAVFEVNDEFIELYNTTGSAVDISGWQMWDPGKKNYFTFPASTFVPANGYVVVIGGWDGSPLPSDYYSAGSASGTGIINNSQDNVVVLDPNAIPPTYLQATYSGDSVDDPTTYTGFPATAVAAGASEEFGSPAGGESAKRESDGAATFKTDAPTPLAANGPLPVDLISFEAKVVGKKQVELNWSTASEENNDYFSIEHSQNGRDFVKLGKIQGSGNSFGVHQYRFTHQDVKEGNNYYRLRQVDFDGAFSFSPVEIAIIRAASDISLQPTLAESQVVLKFGSDLEKDIKGEVLNINGQVVKAFSMERDTENFQLDIQDLQPGHYVVRLVYGAQPQALRFIKK